MKNRSQLFSEGLDDASFFISVGDLMSALLLIFVLILSVTLLRLQDEQDQNVEMTNTYRRMSESYEELASTYRQLQDNLYERLHEEFKDDFEEWGTSIDRETLAIRFQEPEVLFAQGEGRVKPEFVDILNQFFPRYISVLRSADYRDSIEEIRIEGHTSSEWESGTDTNTAYFRNMKLSQNRTRNVLEHCLTCLDDTTIREWVRLRITANGLSSAKPILTNGLEDKRASRRVEFRVRTTSEERIAQILRLAEENAAATAADSLGPSRPSTGEQE